MNKTQKNWNDYFEDKNWTDTKGWCDLDGNKLLLDTMENDKKRKRVQNKINKIYRKFNCKDSNNVYFRIEALRRARVSCIFNIIISPFLYFLLYLFISVIFILLNLKLFVVPLFFILLIRLIVKAFNYISDIMYINNKMNDLISSIR